MYLFIIRRWLDTSRRNPKYVCIELRKKILNSEIIAMPAYHWSRRLGQKYNSTLWNGYMINYKKTKIYFSGDTAFGPVFKKLGNKYGPFDLTIVPIGAYEPRGMMQASHCTPEEAVQITQMLQSKKILGMHWGTILSLIHI